MQFELSICIPTYNRAKYLQEALDSIVNQLDENNRNKIEICVSDNASQDNTTELVESYKAKHPHITYFRYLKVIEIAHGKYCWFLGSDDIINKGSINRVLSELQYGYDIYVCNRKVCDLGMNLMHSEIF